MGGFGGGGMGKGWCDVDTRRTRFYFWRLTSVPILVKIDQEMRSWKFARKNTHIHAYWHT